MTNHIRVGQLTNPRNLGFSGLREELKVFSIGGEQAATLYLAFEKKKRKIPASTAPNHLVAIRAMPDTRKEHSEHAW